MNGNEGTSMPIYRRPVSCIQEVLYPRRHHARSSPRSIRRYASSLVWPTVVICCRVAVCIGMSYLGGLTNRIAYASTKWTLLRDVFASALENNIVLLALEGALLSQTTPSRSSVRKASKKIRGGSMGIKLRARRVVQKGIAILIALTWILASWGDFVFESESHGVIPTIWIIAPGLTDPSVHLGVQWRAHRVILVGGLARCALGLCVATAYTLAINKLCNVSDNKLITASVRPKARFRTSEVLSSVSSFRGLSDIQRQPNFIGLNIGMLTILFWMGAWAPLTNLIYSVAAVYILTPPGGGLVDGELTMRVRTDVKRSEDSPASPNVILIVHESLSGAALRSSTGIDAAPFFHSLRSDSDFYEFKYARTVAGTTQIATPGLLTGLMAYTDEGVQMVKRSSLASDFKKLGYKTGCFASYGTAWGSSGAWALLTDLMVPFFDAIFTPKSTDDPVVNEYGSDDRKMANHFRDWMLSNNATTVVPDRNDSNDARNSSPFFALIVQNNNHFPHLWHETYNGDPNCNESAEALEMNVRRAAETEGSANFEGDTFEGNNFDDIYYEGDYFGQSCGFSEVSRYYSSIRTIDESLQTIFDALKESGELNNTILIGAGDHGDIPGVLERMNDVNAAILDIPLWIYVPKKMLPERALYTTVSKSSNGTNTSTGRETYLRTNTNRGVSILDAVPTLRDLIGFDDIFTKEEEEKCVTGVSLLSAPVAEDRIMLAWQGKPLQNHQIGTFSTKEDALVFYERDPSKSKHVDFRFDDKDVFFNRSETVLAESPQFRDRWRDLLQSKGLLNHSAVRKWMMPALQKVMNGDRESSKRMR